MGLVVAQGEGLVAAGVAEGVGGGSHQFGRRVEQRQGVEDFQPGALTVLGADAEGDAVEVLRHGD
ncbi:hypothetical protein D3C81_2046880 [compost metagenome]